MQPYSSQQLSRQEESLLKILQNQLQELRSGAFSTYSFTGLQVSISQSDELSVLVEQPRKIESGHRLSRDGDYDGREVYARFLFSDGLETEVSGRLDRVDSQSAVALVRTRPQGWTPAPWLGEEANSNSWAQTYMIYPATLEHLGVLL